MQDMQVFANKIDCADVQPCRNAVSAFYWLLRT